MWVIYFYFAGQWIISQVHYYYQTPRSLSQGEAMLLLAIIHFHCAPHFPPLSSHRYPIPNFCNSFIGSISTPFIHLNFNKLLHSLFVILPFCSSMMDSISILMTVDWNMKHDGLHIDYTLQCIETCIMLLFNFCYMTFKSWGLSFQER